MVEFLCAVIGVLLVVIAVLIIKLCTLRKAAREISDAFAERLKTDTNTVIDISSRDREMRRLADAVNDQLRLLRKQRRQYLNGDRELKEAVTNISHDLRTPLTAICGYLDLLDKQDQSEEVSRYLAHIRNRAEALKQLTEELFRYSVILSTAGELTLEVCDLRGLLEEAVATHYGALVERNITPMITMPDQGVVRTVDRRAMSRVLSNLLSNAIKYSDGDLKIILKDTGEMVFSNQASGLDEIQVGRLFDRFYTVTAARHATGLGLAIAKALIEQMDGQIKAEYAEGYLSITIYLP